MAEQVFVAVTDFATEGEAERRAVRLVSDGIGASVAHGSQPAESDDEPPEIRWQVMVLTGDRVRACEVLGLPVPEDLQEAPPQMPWKTILAIWLAAMIILPLAAFYLTVSLSD